jgi:hypothetical protein
MLNVDQTLNQAMQLGLIEYDTIIGKSEDELKSLAEYLNDQINNQVRD